MCFGSRPPTGFFFDGKRDTAPDNIQGSAKQWFFEPRGDTWGRVVVEGGNNHLHEMASMKGGFSPQL